MSMVTLDLKVTLDLLDPPDLLVVLVLRYAAKSSYNDYMYVNKWTCINVSLFFIQGPAGATGPKGARGGAGAPVRTSFDT